MVGALVDLTVAGGDLEPKVLGDLVVGAGFDVAAAGGDEAAALRVRLRRARSLPDFVGPGMRLLVCGLNPSLFAADAGVPFARRSNRFWPAAVAAGVVSVAYDPASALRRDGVGLTDLVKRATRSADELGVEEYRAGLARVERLCAWLRPGAVCFVGLAGWRTVIDRHATPGLQPEGLGGCPLYLMPSTSGRNAHADPAVLRKHLAAASEAAVTAPPS